MQFLLTGLVAAVAILHTAASEPLKRTDPVVVRAVIDGDTIDVSNYGRVRLLGIDAPEIGRGFDTPAPFGAEARDRLASLVLHRWVRLEQDGMTTDVYNRRLAYVLREDGLFVNAALVREGLARVSARIALVRLDELKHAEEEAQAFRRGMWGETPQVPAASYTRRSGRRTTPASRTRTPPRTRRRSHKSKSSMVHFRNTVTHQGRRGGMASGRMPPYF